MSTTAKLNKGSVQPERDVELNADAAAEGAVSTFVSSAAVSFQTNLSSIMSTDFVACSNNVDSNDSVPETDTEIAEADLEEKQRLISQILELQHTLEDLSTRVDAVKEENLKLRSENQILGQYIENMMANSSVFQSTSPLSDGNRSRTTNKKLRDE
uniref:Short coiled-coil protein n=1 Tax=Trichobilharzia regenti TaxID=157069 RepID=A0AA85IU62_TRIRE|nr:unnamed protein product [Trichobilharzia regenti]